MKQENKEYFIEWDGDPRKRYQLLISILVFSDLKWIHWGNYHTYNGAVVAHRDLNEYFGNKYEMSKIRDRSNGWVSYIE